MLYNTDHEILAVMHKADIGDELEVECIGKRPRKVVVTDILDGSLLTSSGRVRPGHREGGRLKDYGDGYGVMYQGTMLQKVCRVTSLKFVRRAKSRN